MSNITKCIVCNKDWDMDLDEDGGRPHNFERCPDCDVLWHYGLGHYPGVYEIVRCHPNNGTGDYYKIAEADKLFAKKDSHISELETELNYVKHQLAEKGIIK